MEAGSHRPLDPEALRAALAAPDVASREGAALLAGEEVVVALAVPLREALEDPAPEVRRAAARALAAIHAFRGDTGDAEVVAVVGALIARLTDEEGPRTAAAAALGLIGDPRAALPLVARLDDPSVSELAEEALLHLAVGSAEVADALGVVALRGGVGGGAALRLLREVGPQALPVLGRLLDGPAAPRVLAVLPPLGAHLGPLVPQVARLARGPDAALAVAVLVAAGAEDEALAALDHHPRCWPAALAAIEDPSRLGIAVRALFEPTPMIRLAALDALARHAEAAKAFAGEIALLRDDPDPAVSAAARRLSPG